MSNREVSIVSLLFNSSPKLLVFAVIIGVLSGFFYSLIIPFAINGIEARVVSADLSSSTVSTTSSTAFLFSSDIISNNKALCFFVMVLFILLTKALAVILVNNIAKSATAELKSDLVKKISRMKVDNVLSVGFSRLINILAYDVNSVVGAAGAIPMLVVSVVTVLGMLGYLAILNIYVFIMVLVAIIFGVFLFQTPVKMVQGLYEKSRVLTDTIQEGVRGLVFGVFELKLDTEKSQNYIAEEIIEPQNKSIKLEKVGDAIMCLADTSSDLLSFFIIGGMVFILPHYIDLPTADSFGIVMALLYIAGPVGAILGMLQQVEIGKIALKRIHEINDYEEEIISTDSTLETKWSCYTVKGISYQYADNDKSFCLKPVSLSFARGEINFIVGGNGSGKSTLSKLLSLHYHSNSGEISFDDTILSHNNIAYARERISVIYSDYYLFRKLYRKYSQQDELKINKYLHSLGLVGKTEFVDGYFTSTNLSDGQRRRLALLLALIEDKDIYIFDEWAADQDPEFKKIFYQDILHQMKIDNKLVIVITHDDRYFDCADRVIFMEEGMVVEVSSITPSKVNTPSLIASRDLAVISDDVIAT
jgi:putative ATP-binding cassette transporter